MMNYVPARDSQWALFLDVDGTLLEIAATPDAVKVPAALRAALNKAAKRESGAVALISGRSLSDLDKLFAGVKLPAAAVHGVIRRNASGQIFWPQIDVDALNAARATLAEFALRHPGALLEDKHYAIALHFRNAPALAKAVRAVVAATCEKLGSGFHAQVGKCVYEIKPAGYSKGSAVDAFMRESPFAGRVPVFVGDDATDESGFVAANRLNGISIRVGALQKSAARFRLANVNAVTHWLANPTVHAKVG